MSKKTDESTDAMLHIRLKSSILTNPSQPSILSIPTSLLPTLTVSQFKEEIHAQQALGQNVRGRYIRLIHSGRLMAPDDAKVEQFKIGDGSVVHAVVAAAGVQGGQQALLSQPEDSDVRGSGNGDGHRRRRRLRGLGIGLDGIVISRRNRSGESEDNRDDEDDDEDIEAGRERIGFDRLRADGLSRSEIIALRIYFSRSIDRFIEHRNESGNSNSDDNDDINEDDPDPEATSRNRRLRMEDEWMQAQGPTSEFRLNLNAANPLLNRRALFRRRNGAGSRSNVDPMYTGPLGTDRDFVWGFTLGYFVGFFMMFWVWMPTVPHRQKLGILVGICCQMAGNVLGEDNDKE